MGLKATKIGKKEAPTIGIAVDFRRRNRSQETFRKNVDRLKLYKSKLVLFPRNRKKGKKGEATKEECASAKQIIGCKIVLPIKKEKKQKEKVDFTIFRFFNICNHN